MEYYNNTLSDKEELIDYIRQKVYKDYKVMPRIYNTEYGFAVHISILSVVLMLTYHIILSKYIVFYQKNTYDIYNIDYDEHIEKHYFDTFDDVFDYTQYVIDTILPPKIYY